MIVEIGRDFSALIISGPNAGGKTVALNYLMHKSGAEWKIMDVYLDGAISELATRRSEFGAILKSGGPDGLIASLSRQGDKLLAGGP